MASDSIKNISLSEVSVLKLLFDQALDSDFGYFPANYLDEVRRQNSLMRLGTAVVRPDRLVLGLWANRTLSGYVIAKLKRNQNAYIFWLFVRPECRGQGLGNRLLGQTLDIFSRYNIGRIDLVTHNRKDFYLRHGFQVDQFKPQFIDDVGVYMMSRNLS